MVLKPGELFRTWNGKVSQDMAGVDGLNPFSWRELELILWFAVPQVSPMALKQWRWMVCRKCPCVAVGWKPPKAERSPR